MRDIKKQREMFHMYCHFCGAPMPDDGTSCPACGKAVAAAPSAPLPGRTRTLPVWVGILLALGAVLPLLLPNGAPANQAAAQYGAGAIAALSALSQTLTGWCAALQLVASASTLLLAALVLRRATRLRPVLFVTLAAQGAVILRALLACILVYAAPQLTLARFGGNAEVMQAAELVLREGMLDAQRNMVLLKALLAGGLLLVSCLLLRRCPAGGSRRLLIGAALLLPVLAVLWLLRGALSTQLLLHFGETAYSAAILAEQVFLSRCGGVLIALLLLALLLSVWLRGGRVYTLLPLLGVLLTFGAVCYVLAPDMLRALVVLPEQMALALPALRSHILGALLVLSAAFLWLAAVGKNRLPTAVQLALPLACLLLYPLAQLLSFTLLRSTMLPLGALLVALTLGIPALCIHSTAPEGAD